ncbi:MAG: putative serine/threonine protein kinase with sensor [Fibrobacteres bacterium]|nr:putative serine/threonine protein kinase with sensor [Fibrobacterota bacterium]
MLSRFLSRPFFLALFLWFLTAAILYMLINMVAMPYVAGKFKGTVKVPALVSLPPEQAKAILVKNDLIYMLDSTGDYSTDVAAGKILTQYPETGTEVKKGRRIWVKISKGFKSVEMPALRGLSLRQAEITLQQLGLKVGRVREVRNTLIPAGAVIGTSPAAKATLEKGREVNIELSMGKDSESEGMPSLTGMSLSQAKEEVRKRGLSLGKITFKKDPKSLPNTVLSQSPSAGGETKGHSVDLVVTK